jgi:hypothetical protein
MRRIVAIDPGVGGGIAVLDDNAVTAVKMPAESDLAPMLADLATLSDIPLEAYIEDVPKGIAGKVNQSAMAKLHRNFGFCLGVMSALKIRHHLVRPQKWQQGIPGLMGKKEAHRKRALKDHACRLFPDIKVTLKTADALLIAEWGKRYSLSAEPSPPSLDDGGD